VPRADQLESRWAPVVAWGDAENLVYFLFRHSYLNAPKVLLIDPGSTRVAESLAAWVSAYPHRCHHSDTEDADSDQLEPRSLRSNRCSTWIGV
jgi:hypothetical protein